MYYDHFREALDIRSQLPDKTENMTENERERKNRINGQMAQLCTESIIKIRINSLVESERQHLPPQTTCL